MSKTWAGAFVRATELGLRIFFPKRRWIIRSLIYGQMNGTLPISTRQGELTFYICNRQTLKFAHDFETFEPDTLRWIEQMPHDAVLWDIGANVGLFSLYAALRPEIRVVAFEPAASTYDTLVKNIQLNNLGSRASAYCIALGDRTRCSVLNMSSLEAGHYMHSLQSSERSDGVEAKGNLEQPVLEMSIDDFIRVFNPPLPTHIKLDVDSNESEIIAGARELLAQETVRSLQVEMVGDLDSTQNRKIQKSLEDHKFQPSPKEDRGFSNVEFRRM
ncbi:MAG: FkbM family methyltransferase [Rhodospirillales bacterium]|nr:FkbM family methyltransferase [Rhodospirillales bacterium]